VAEVAPERMPATPTKLMMNVGNPELAFEFRRLPNEGVGLARLEFIINKNVGIHPKALIEFDRQTPELQREIRQRIGGYASPTEFYVSKIAEGVATIAAAFWPKNVIVRLSDFKSNEYSNLVGAALRAERETGWDSAARHATSQRSSTTASRPSARRWPRA
jgi:pyruvate,water dikinase